LKVWIKVIIVLIPIIILSFFSLVFRFLVCCFLSAVMAFGCFLVNKFRNPLRVLSVYSIIAQIIVLVLYSLLTVVIDETEIRYMSLVFASPLDYWFVLMYICNAIILMVVFLNQKTWSFVGSKKGQYLFSLIIVMNIFLSFGILFSIVQTTEQQIIDFNLNDYIFSMSLLAGLGAAMPQLFLLEILSGSTISEEQQNLLPSYIRPFLKKQDELLKRLEKEGKVEIKEPMKIVYKKGSFGYYIAWTFIIGMFAFSVGFQGWMFLDIMYRGWLLQPAIWIGVICWSLLGYLISPYLIISKVRRIFGLSLLVIYLFSRISFISQFISTFFLFLTFMFLRIFVETRKKERPSWL